MQRFFVVTCLLFVALSSVGGQRRSTSSGSATASGGGSTFSSGGGSTSGTVRSFVSVSTSAGSKKKKKKTQTPRGFEDFFAETTTTEEEGTGQGKTKRKEKVAIEDDAVTSESFVTSSGPASASASASTGPKGQAGSASTTADGTKRTVSKRRNQGGKTKTKRSTQKDDIPSDKKKEKKSKSKGKTERAAETSFSSDFFGIQTCKGLAKFKCCDDRDFSDIDGVAYCGCWGDGTRKEFCSFERLNADPLVVRDVFAATLGETCRCASAVPVNSDKCTGVVKRECCDQYNGKKNCGCAGKVCQYKRVSNAPLTWKSRFTKQSCTC